MRYAPIYRLSLVSDGRLPYDDTLRQSSDVARFVRPLFDRIDREMFVVVLLNAKHRPDRGARGFDRVTYGISGAPQRNIQVRCGWQCQCDLHLS